MTGIDVSRRTNYGRVARLYDWCADVGSLGAIPLAKKLHLMELAPGDSVIYVGGGSSEEAVLAASRGHRVTILDSSDRMLALAHARFTRAGLESRLTLLHEDFFQFATAERFNAVALHFFLDIFDLPTVHVVLEKCSTLLAAGGRIFVADFSSQNGPMPVQLAQWCYHQGGALACALMAGQPWLQIADYAAACTTSGLVIEKRRNIGLRWFGRSWFMFLSATPGDAKSGADSSMTPSQ